MNDILRMHGRMEKRAAAADDLLPSPVSQVPLPEVDAPAASGSTGSMASMEQREQGREEGGADARAPAPAEQVSFSGFHGQAI